MSDVRSETNDGIVTITIDRPKAMNALNQEVLDGLREAIAAIERDRSIRGAVLTGAGEKAFVAGADIGAMREMSAQEAEAFSRAGHGVMDAVAACRVPVIAAVNGFALGGGLELALACDFIYASDRAVLGLVEVKLGLIPGFGGVGRLLRRIGVAQAREAIYSARQFDASEALRIGLVNRVCAPDALLDEVRATLASIGAKGPCAVALAKSLIESAQDAHLAEANALEQRSFGLVFASDDAKEGIAAFLEKRKPAFKAC